MSKLIDILGLSAFWSKIYTGYVIKKKAERASDNKILTTWDSEGRAILSTNSFSSDGLTDIPTAGAVKMFVEGKGYKTTDNNTTYSLGVNQNSATNGNAKVKLTPSSGNATTVTIKGSGATSVTTDASGDIVVSSSNAVTGVKGASESSYKTGNVNITAANIGLGEVDNESKATMFTSPNFTGTATYKNKEIATKEDITNSFAANDAMRFIGVINQSASNVTSPTPWGNKLSAFGTGNNDIQKGWTWKVGVTGWYAFSVNASSKILQYKFSTTKLEAYDYYEAGDMFIITDETEATTSTLMSHFAVVQENIANAVSWANNGALYSRSLVSVDSNGRLLTSTNEAGNATTPIYIDSVGVPTALTYTIAKSVPSDAVFTDQSTTKSGHYTPNDTGASTYSASGATATDIANGSGFQVVTGVKYDGKGHVVGITSGSLKATNTTYTSLKNPNAVTFAATGGATAGSSYDGSSTLTVNYATVGAAPASTVGVSSSTAVTSFGNKKGDITLDETTATTTKVKFAMNNNQLTGSVAAYADASTSKSGLMTSAMVTKLNGIATGANAYTLPPATTGAIGGVKVSETNGYTSLYNSNNPTQIINTFSDANRNEAVYYLKINGNNLAGVKVELATYSDIESIFTTGGTSGTLPGYNEGVEDAGIIS